MRIDAYSAVTQVYQTAKTTATAKKQNVKSQNDKLEISQAARDIQVAKAAVSASDDVRADKVAQIKAQMAAGTYNISSADVADKILSNSNSSTVMF